MPTNTTEADKVYAPHEAAPRLHPDLKPRTLERWRQNGTGPKFVRIGRRVGYTGAALEEFKTQQTRQHTDRSRPTSRSAK